VLGAAFPPVGGPAVRRFSTSVVELGDDTARGVARGQRVATPPAGLRFVTRKSGGPGFTGGVGSPGPPFRGGGGHAPSRSRAYPQNKFDRLPWFQLPSTITIYSYCRWQLLSTRVVFVALSVAYADRDRIEAGRRDGVRTKPTTLSTISPTIP
jgi:hypothetical protein